nr:hypothetical protein [Dictyobacter kobayashii]
MFLASEVPPGTGLGSSSAAAVTLIRALSTLLEQSMTKYQIAEIASFIEIDKMKLPIGKQDQYAAAFGGLNKFTFTDKGVTVESLKIDPDVMNTLEKRLMLFFMGNSRESSSILKHQQKSIQNHDSKTIHALNNIKAIAENMQCCLEHGNLDEFALLMHHSWQEKRCLAPGLSTPFIDKCYNLALHNGALGGKINGAGGGGFLMLYSHEEAQNDITHNLEEYGLKRMNFRFDNQGATVLLNVTNFNNLKIDTYSATS